MAVVAYIGPNTVKISSTALEGITGIFINYEQNLHDAITVDGKSYSDVVVVGSQKVSVEVTGIDRESLTTLISTATGSVDMTFKVGVNETASEKTITLKSPCGFVWTSGLNTQKDTVAEFAVKGYCIPASDADPVSVA